MTISKREIAKLRAIGCEVEWFHGASGGPCAIVMKGIDTEFSKFKSIHPTMDAAWAACGGYVTSPNGMVATMASKLTWLNTAGGDYRAVRIWWEEQADGEFFFASLEGGSVPDQSGPTPEAAVDRLFWESD